MDIEIQDSNSHKVISVTGKIDSNTAPQLEQALTALIQDGHAKLVTDFEHLSFISSAGLRVLLAAAKSLKSTNGELKICNMNSTVTEIFAISGFSTILRVFPSLDEAVMS